MGKYDNLRTLKTTKARTQHVCYKCGKEISPGETYYREQIEDKFLHSLHSKKYCSSCYEKYGNRPLASKVKTSCQSILLEEFNDR
jgi:uncharacterized protein with PIN domain